MDDPKKEKDRMNFYGGLSDIFLDKKYEKLVSDAPTEEMWIALDKLKESGNELVNKWTGEPKGNPIPASSNVAPNPFLPPVPEHQNNKPVNYDAQLETVLKQVDEYNANLEKFEKSYYSNLIKANANISACNNQYADIVSNYNGHLEDVRKHTSDVVFETLSKEGGKVTISYKDGNLLVDDAKTNAYETFIWSSAKYLEIEE